MMICFGDDARVCVRALAATALGLLAACGGDGPVVPEPPKEVACNGVATSVRTLAPLESVVPK